MKGLKVNKSTLLEIVIAIIIMVMIHLKLFEYAIVTLLFVIFSQLLLLNGKMK
jgi:hypothetical protein